MEKLDPQHTRPSRPLWLPAVAVGLSALAAYWWATRRTPQLVPAAHIEPVSDFDVSRFVGDWYEIARMERGLGKPLTRSRMEYTLQSDGDLRITSRGFHVASNRWVEATGLARFVGSPNFGAMKASFFGPFFEGHHVVAIDPDYRWAMLMGDTTESFKLLSRSPVLDGETTNRLLHLAELMGVHTDRIHWVMQDGINPVGL